MNLDRLNPVHMNPQLDSDLAPPPVLPKPSKDNARLQKLKKKRNKKKTGLCQTPVPFRSCLSPVNEVQTDLELDLDPRSPSPPKPEERPDQKPDQRVTQMLKSQSIQQKPSLQILDPRLTSDQDLRLNHRFTHQCGTGPVQVWTGSNPQPDFSPEINPTSGFSFMRNQVQNQLLQPSPVSHGLVQSYPGSETRFYPDFGCQTHFSSGSGPSLEPVWAKSEQKVAPLFECSGFMFDEELTQNQVYSQHRVFPQNQVFPQSQVYPQNQVYSQNHVYLQNQIYPTGPALNRIPVQTFPSYRPAAYSPYSNMSMATSYPLLNQTRPSPDPDPVPWIPGPDPKTPPQLSPDQTTTFSIQIQTRDPALERIREVNRLSAMNPGFSLVPDMQTQTSSKLEPTTKSPNLQQSGPSSVANPLDHDQSRFQAGLGPSQSSFRSHPDPVLSGPSVNGLFFSQTNKDQVQDPVQVQTESRTFTSKASFSVSMQDNKTNRNLDFQNTKPGLNQELKLGSDPGNSKAKIKVQDPKTGSQKRSLHLGINGVHEESITEAFQEQMTLDTVEEFIWTSTDSRARPRPENKDFTKTRNKVGSKPDVKVLKSPDMDLGQGLELEDFKVSKAGLGLQKSPTLVHVEPASCSEKPSSSLDFNKKITVLQKPEVAYVNPVKLQEFNLRENVDSGLQPLPQESIHESDNWCRDESKNWAREWSWDESKNLSTDESNNHPILGISDQGLVSSKDKVSFINSNVAESEKLTLSEMFHKSPTGVMDLKTRSSKNLVQALELRLSPVQMNSDLKRSEKPAERAAVKNNFPKSPTQIREVHRKLEDPNRSGVDAEGSLPKFPTFITVPTKPGLNPGFGLKANSNPAQKTLSVSSLSPCLNPGQSPGLSSRLNLITDPDFKVLEQPQPLRAVSVLSLSPLKTNLDSRPQTFSPVTVQTLSCLSSSPVLDPDQVFEARKSLSLILETQIKTQNPSRPRSYYGLTPTQYEAFGGIKTRTKDEDQLKPRTKPGPGLESELVLKEDQSETKSEPRIRSVDLRDPTGERPGVDWTKTSDQVYKGPEQDQTTPQDWTKDLSWTTDQIQTKANSILDQEQSKTNSGLDQDQTKANSDPDQDRNKANSGLDHDQSKVNSGLEQETFKNNTETGSRTKPSLGWTQDRILDHVRLDWSQPGVCDSFWLNSLKTGTGPEPVSVGLPQVNYLKEQDWTEIRISKGLDQVKAGPDQTNARPKPGPNKITDKGKIYNLPKLDSRIKPDQENTVSPSPVLDLDPGLDFQKSRPAPGQLQERVQVFDKEQSAGLESYSKLDSVSEPGLKPDLLPRPSPRIKRNQTCQIAYLQSPDLVEIPLDPGPDPESGSSLPNNYNSLISDTNEVKFNPAFSSLGPVLDLDLSSGVDTGQSWPGPRHKSDFVGFQNSKYKSNPPLDQDSNQCFTRPAESQLQTERVQWSGSETFHGHSPVVEPKKRNSPDKPPENPPSTGSIQGPESGPEFKPEVKKRSETPETSSEQNKALGPKLGLKSGLGPGLGKLQAEPTDALDSSIDFYSQHSVLCESGFDAGLGLGLDLLDMDPGLSVLDSDPSQQKELKTQQSLPEYGKETGDGDVELCKTQDTRPRIKSLETEAGLDIELPLGHGLRPNSGLETSEEAEDDSADFQILEACSENLPSVESYVEFRIGPESEQGLKISETSSGSGQEPVGLKTHDTVLKTGQGLGSVIDSGSLPQEPDTEKSWSSRPKTGLGPPQSPSKIPLKTSMKTSIGFSMEGRGLVSAKSDQDQIKIQSRNKEATLKTRLRLKETLKETMDKLDKILDKKGLKKKTRTLDFSEMQTGIRSGFQDSLQQEKTSRTDKCHSHIQPTCEHSLTVKHLRKEDAKTDLGQDPEPTKTKNLDLNQTKCVQKPGYHPEANLECTEIFQKLTMVTDGQETISRDLEPPQSPDLTDWTQTSPGPVRWETLLDLNQDSVDQLVCNMDSKTAEIPTRIQTQTQTQTRTWTEPRLNPDLNLDSVDNSLMEQFLLESLDTQEIEPVQKMEEHVIELKSVQGLTQAETQAKIQTMTQIETQRGLGPELIFWDLKQDLQNSSLTCLISPELVEEQNLNGSVQDLKATLPNSLTLMGSQDSIDSELTQTQVQTQIQTETRVPLFSKRSVTSPASSSEGQIADREQHVTLSHCEQKATEDQPKTGLEPEQDLDKTKIQVQTEGKSLKCRGKKTEKLKHLLEKAKAECEILESKIRMKSTKKIPEPDPVSSATGRAQTRGIVRSDELVTENLDQQFTESKATKQEETVSPEKHQMFDSDPAADRMKSDVQERTLTMGQDLYSGLGSEPEAGPALYKDIKSKPCPDKDQEMLQSSPNINVDKSENSPQVQEETESPKDLDTISSPLQDQDQSTNLCEEVNGIVDSAEAKDPSQPSLGISEDEFRSPLKVQYKDSDPDKEPESRPHSDKEQNKSSKPTSQSKSGSDKNIKSLMGLFKKEESKSEDQDEFPDPPKDKSKSGPGTSLKSLSKSLGSKVSGWTRLKKHMVVEPEEPLFPSSDPEYENTQGLECSPEPSPEVDLSPDLDLAQTRAESGPKALKMWDALLFHMFSTKERIMKQLEINHSQKNQELAKSQIKAQNDSDPEPSFASRLPLLLYSPRFDARKLKEAAEKPISKLSTAFERALIRRKTSEDPKKDFNRRPKGFSL